MPSGEGDPLPRRWRAAGLRVLLWAGVDGPSARSTRACAEAGIAVARTPTKATQLVRSLRTALLALEAGNADGAKVLEYLKAGKFVEADISEWQGYVDLLESGIDIGG